MPPSSQFHKQVAFYLRGGGGGNGLRYVCTFVEISTRGRETTRTWRGAPGSPRTTHRADVERMTSDVILCQFGLAGDFSTRSVRVTVRAIGHIYIYRCTLLLCF